MRVSLLLSMLLFLSTSLFAVTTLDGKVILKPVDISLIYVSKETCDNLKQSWADYRDAVYKAHTDCVNAISHGGKAHRETELARTCQYVSCDEIHQAMMDSSKEGGDEVADCYNALQIKEEKEEAAKTHSSPEVESVFDKKDTVDKGLEAKDAASDPKGYAISKVNPVDKAASKIQEKSWDEIHKNATYVDKKLEDTKEKVDSMKTEKGYSPTTAKVPAPSYSSAAVPDKYQEIVSKAMSETDPNKLKQMIRDFKSQSERDNCGIPCFKIVDEMNKRLREID